MDNECTAVDGGLLKRCSGGLQVSEVGLVGIVEAVSLVGVMEALARWLRQCTYHLIVFTIDLCFVLIFPGYKELEHQVSLIRDVSKKVFSEMGTSIGYKIGTMIEIPRAALVADEIAEQVEFFSFGTNDLTQMTFRYSRDDVGKFLPIYLSKGILQHDPFEEQLRERSKF
ncbi:hypothetical protein Syun_003973 [Stephania yunnanensis]|uniref:PEP-utilising enzyme C-terminal domain-containing protein n=1 Tax=Stephania yunnanensis TaxID=152371 RepID=A0AAP0L288_9MAGN